MKGQKSEKREGREVWRELPQNGSSNSCQVKCWFICGEWLSGRTQITLSYGRKTISGTKWLSDSGCQSRNITFILIEIKTGYGVLEQGVVGLWQHPLAWSGFHNIQDLKFCSMIFSTPCIKIVPAPLDGCTSCCSQSPKNSTQPNIQLQIWWNPGQGNTKTLSEMENAMFLYHAKDIWILTRCYISLSFYLCFPNRFEKYLSLFSIPIS